MTTKLLLIDVRLDDLEEEIKQTKIYGSPDLESELQSIYDEIEELETQRAQMVEKLRALRAQAVDVE